MRILGGDDALAAPVVEANLLQSTQAGVDEQRPGGRVDGYRERVQRERVDRIPDALAELILRLLEKAPDPRCESALEVSEALAPLAKSRPT